MINNMSYRSCRPLLRERGTNLPLQAVGGLVGALDEPRVELEAPTSRAMVEGNGA